MRTTLAFALVGVVAAAGCGDDNKNTPDAAIDARPIDAPLPVAVLSLSPLTSDFGSVVIGQTSSAMTFTVTNTTAGDPSGPISATIMGSGAANFAVETNGCTTLASHATCTVTVSFSPQAGTTTNRTATLVVAASPGGSVSATLDGKATQLGNLSINPSTNAFGNVIVGSTSTSSATFTVTNTGGTSVGPLTTTAAGSDPGDFQKVTDTCNGQSVAAAATCTLTVNFKPGSAGAKSANFTVTATGTNSVSANVTGNGISQANIVINPSLQDFGTVVAGGTSGNVTFTVANTGGSPSGALSQTVSGADLASFTIVSGNCAGTTLAPAATCNVILRFSPATAGAKAAQFSITGVPGGTANATLLGTGQSPGLLTITPSPVAFADTTVGQASASQTFTVTNTGASPTTAIITSLGGNDPSQFTIVAGSNGCQGTILAGGGTCTIAVTFTPTVGGAKSANLSASANTGGTATAGISGNGIPAALFTIAPASHDFGALGIGTNSSFFSFTVTNAGGQTSAVPTVALGGANATQFVLQNGCTAALAPLGTCTVQVRFSPNINGNDTATVTVSGTPGGTAAATVFGQAVTPAALQTTAGVTSLNFDHDAASKTLQTLIGDTDTETYTLINTGAEPTGPITFTKSGANQADYTFTSNCTTLPMNMTCTVTVTFTPTASGLKTAALLASATPGGSVSVALAGTARPRLEITLPSTNPFDFGSAIVNTVSPTSVTTHFQNNASTTKTITTAALTNTTDFNITANGCGVAVTAGNGCDVTLNFIPKSIGSKTATLGASVGAAPADAASQVYTGTGVDSLVITGATNLPTVTCAAGVCDFGNVALGAVSGTLTVTVTNPAGAPNASSISTTLNNTDFQIVSDGCASVALTTGMPCTMVVQFQPTGALGAKTGALTVTASPSGGSTSLTLKGNAVPGAALTFNPDATLAFGNTFSGATNDKTIVVTNTGGAPAGGLTFSLTGSSMPYTLNPAPAVMGDCTTNLVLAPTGSMGNSCTLRIRFTGSGAISANTPAAAAGVQFATAGNNPLATPHNVGFTATVVPTISISPTPFNFGNSVVVNTTLTQAFTVTNNSAAAVTVTSSVIAGAADTTITANTCTTIAAAGTCTVTVQFAPTTTGNSSRTLTVNSANGIAIATMTAHVLTPSSLAWSPPSADLGSALAAAANGGSATFTLTNSGETAAPIAVAINDTTNYTLTTTCTASLAGNSTCTATVKFTPPALAATGAKNAILTSGGAGPVTAAVTAAVVTSGSLVITPPTASFADTLTNVASATVNVLTVVNTAATTTAFTFTASPNFGTSAATTCGASLAAGAQCTIATTFTPTTAGLKQGTLTLSTGAYTALSGTGLTPAVVDFTTLKTNAYGMVAVGDSGTFTFSLKNTGGVTAGVLSTGALAGTDPGSFQIASDGCAGKSLAPNATCDIKVNFNPAGVGAKASQFTVTSSSLVMSPVTVTLTGNGVLQAVLGITPSVGQNAGTAAVGHHGTVTTFTIQNGGDVSISSPLILTLSNTADYLISGGTCVSGTTILTAGTTCTVDVQFFPATVGTDVTTLTAKASAGPGTTQVTNTVTGTGTATITVNPTSQAFGTVANHMASAPFMFTFTNNADTATGILHTILGGPDSTSFSITMDNCAGKTLATTATCTIFAKFTPQTTGAKTATLDVTGAAGVAQSTLTGTSN